MAYKVQASSRLQTNFSTPKSTDSIQRTELFIILLMIIIMYAFEFCLSNYEFDFEKLSFFFV